MTRTSVKGYRGICIGRLLGVGSRLGPMHDAARQFRTLSSSHTVATRRWPHHYPACGGYGLRKAGPVFRAALNANSRFGSLTWIHGADRLRDECKVSDQAAFITAPSITTPAVAYFHSAMRSLRASATIVGFLRRPPLCRTRSWNQRASAESG